VKIECDCECKCKKIKCPYCEIEYCKEFFKNYLLSSLFDIHCKSCNIKFTETEITQLFEKSFIKIYKNSRHYIILKKEESLLPYTQEISLYLKKIRENKEKIREYQTKIREYQEKIRELMNNNIELEKNSCNTNLTCITFNKCTNCNGYINRNNICELCDHSHQLHNITYELCDNCNQLITIIGQYKICISCEQIYDLFKNKLNKPQFNLYKWFSYKDTLIKSDKTIDELKKQILFITNTYSHYNSIHYINQDNRIKYILSDITYDEFKKKIKYDNITTQEYSKDIIKYYLCILQEWINVSYPYITEETLRNECNDLVKQKCNIDNFITYVI